MILPSPSRPHCHKFSWYACDVIRIRGKWVRGRVCEWAVATLHRTRTARHRASLHNAFRLAPSHLPPLRLYNLPAPLTSPLSSTHTHTHAHPHQPTHIPKSTKPLTRLKPSKNVHYYLDRPRPRRPRRRCTYRGFRQPFRPHHDVRPGQLRRRGQLPLRGQGRVPQLRW
jgi:hypothetical protein